MATPNAKAPPFADERGGPAQYSAKQLRSRFVSASAAPPAAIASPTPRTAAPALNRPPCTPTPRTTTRPSERARSPVAE